jgi:hypothetical protein
LLAHNNNALPNSSTSSSSNALDSRSQVNTLIRSRDAAGRMIVQFESPAAARQSLAAAEVVAAAAAGAGEEAVAAAAAAAAAGGGAGRAFAGGWLVDLLHAAVHKAIERSAGILSA